MKQCTIVDGPKFDLLGNGWYTDSQGMYGF